MTYNQKLNSWIISHSGAIKIFLFIICLVPLALMTFNLFNHNLGANPVEKLTRNTGEWGIRFLWACLFVTPLRITFSLNSLVRFRRMLGLYAFFYILLHFIIWFWLDMDFDFSDMLKDAAKRPFILAGLVGFVLMIPLAATSFNKAIKFMGAKNWQRLHWAVYFSAIAGALHFYWMKSSKNNLTEPIIYATILAGLLLYRVVKKYKTKKNT